MAMRKPYVDGAAEQIAEAENGSAGFLQKPFAPESLTRAIGHTLERATS